MDSRSGSPRVTPPRPRKNCRRLVRIVCLLRRAGETSVVGDELEDELLDLCAGAGARAEAGEVRLVGVLGQAGVQVLEPAAGVALVRLGALGEDARELDGVAPRARLAAQ